MTNKNNQELKHKYENKNINKFINTTIFTQCKKQYKTIYSPFFMRNLSSEHLNIN